MKMDKDRDIEELLHEERRKIAYRLCGFMIPPEEISIGTGLSLEEVQDLQKQRQDDYEYRRSINGFYDSRRMELRESDSIVRLKSISTRQHEISAIKIISENLEHLNIMIDEEKDADKKRKFEEHRIKMERDLKEREENLKGWNNGL
jgi:hypothetical protein